MEINELVLEPRSSIWGSVEEPEQIPGHYEGKVASGPRKLLTYKKGEREKFSLVTS